MMPRIIGGRRAVLKKDGSPDVSIVVLQHENGAFEVVIDGASGATWPKYTPKQLASGNTPPSTLESVWQSLLSKYPGYSVTDEQEVDVQAA
jgi:hypothetical protein